ncbi:MAG: methionyl-tRNA formyltransferase, partial [Patescibacteria group bacterium]
LHQSLLPKYRGPSPIQTAILRGDATTGVSVMLLDEGMDSGPIYAQKRERIKKTDTARTLSLRLASVCAELLCKFLPSILAHKVRPEPQNEKKVTITKLLTKEDGGIDWNQSAIQVDRRVRAMIGWPGAWAEWEGANHLRRVRICILEGAPLEASHDVASKIGSLTKLPAFPLVVQTGRGRYIIHKLQREGKQPLMSDAFLRGQQDFYAGRFR